MRLHPFAVLAGTTLLVTLPAPRLPAADGPRVQELRGQRVKGTTFFQVRFEAPRDYAPPRLDRLNPDGSVSRGELARLPRLVPQDDRTRAVYLELQIRAAGNPRGNAAPAALPHLQFVGKASGSGPARLLLLYPLRPANKGENAAPRKGDKPSLARLLPRTEWAEVPVTLDLARATDVPARGNARSAAKEPAADDLEGRWAAAQAARFAVLEAETSQFSFYGFARAATGRKYRVPAPALGRGGEGNDRGWFGRRLYETTTGAEAIAESLALRRLTGGDFRDRAERSIDVGDVRGITIGEHPWEKMMGDRKPSPEPLARLVPHDNYYVHFKNIVRLIEFGELLDQWGTSLSRAYEVNSRDYQIKERLEKQLCLQSSSLGKLLGPLVVKSLAITGSDPYVREGSDVTVIFHVANRQLFLAGLDPFLAAARKEFGKALRESRTDYHKITVESHVTPLREVSLHRAVFDEYVVYSNSPVGLRRVLDAYQGRQKRLADARDFQYMRTNFRLEDKEEDGFVFLSDAFLRRLVGPADKIKEQRRREALTSLFMLTDGALFSAWETGKLPADQKALLAASGLKADELYSPEGAAPTWDAARQTAVSPVYNTIHFATPLIELPIDRITPTERADYERFRLAYLTNWRNYFDPIGIRLSLTANKVRVETYILPLVRNSNYNELKRITGGGTLSIDPSDVSPATVAQLLVHIAPDARERRLLREAVRQRPRRRPRRERNREGNWIGRWLLVRLDDSPAYARLAEWWVRQEIDPRTAKEGPEAVQETVSLFQQIPLTVGLEIKHPVIFTGILVALRNSIQGLEWDEVETYKGVLITRVKAYATFTVYFIRLDGAFYMSFSPASLKDLVDRARARKEEKGKGKDRKLVKLNASLYLSPNAANIRTVVQFILEWESHRRALANEPIWYALYHPGLIGADASAKTARATALRLLGFVPVSPDDAPYHYDRKTDAVVNRRHGSLRRPRLHEGIEPASPLAKFLDQLRSIRADLSFKEDGIYTVLTMDRKAAAK